MKWKLLYGMMGNSRLPPLSTPFRMALMIYASVQLPMPVSLSGVMLGAGTDPKGPLKISPDWSGGAPGLNPAWSGPWQPQPTSAGRKDPICINNLQVRGHIPSRPASVTMKDMLARLVLDSPRDITYSRLRAPNN